ncbi:MAG: hypothetical protein ACRC0L_01635 [Angustibacter sp.]
MRLTNDDDIYRYEGVFIDMRGTENKFPVRYKVIGIFAAALPFWFIVLRIFGAGPFSFFLYGTALAALTSMAASIYVTPEHPLGGRLGTVKAEILAARLAYARSRAPRPVSVRLSRSLRIPK